MANDSSTPETPGCDGDRSTRAVAPDVEGRAHGSPSAAISPVLHFVGSGDAFGTGGRFQTCLRLSLEGGSVLIDCGASSLIALKRAGVDPSAVDAIVLTHLHGDHFAGIPFLILDGQFARRVRPLSIAGPRGTRARVEAAMEVLFPGSSGVKRRFDIDWVELEAGRSASVAGVEVAAFEVVHASGAPALAVRLSVDGIAVAYSGDTEWTDALVEASAGVDVFVCEAYFLEKQVKYHLDYRTLERHLPRLSARRVVLTHMGPEMLDRIGEVALETAHDGLEITVRPREVSPR